jgi:GNAT superfamily N-acetyltransferase
VSAASRKEVYDFFQHVTDNLYRGIMPALFDSDRLAKCNECYVAEADSEIVGAVTLAFDGPRGPTLDTMFVLREHRGHGIGNRLCEVAIRRFVDAEKTPVYCEVIRKDMHRTIERLPDELKTAINPNLSYLIHGDEPLPDDLESLLGDL